MSGINRRNFIALVAGAISAGNIGCRVTGQDETIERNAGKGRLKQSIAQWCFAKYWDLETMCSVANQLGCESIELVDVKDWGVLKRHGLVCGMASSHWFDKGMNNPKYHAMCLAKIRESIDACAEFGFPNVLTFTGLSEGISPELGIKNCVEGYKRVIGYAGQKKVNLCLEILNSRVDVEMVGVPGYQGDHTDYCMEIVKKVGSERMKLLFDIFHVQIMDGDIIRRIQEYKDYIGHYHTAGNPGRGELDDNQEINYSAVFEAIAKTGYKGYVGHEFIPTRNPLEGLCQAVSLCNG